MRSLDKREAPFLKGPPTTGSWVFPNYAYFFADGFAFSKRQSHFFGGSGAPTNISLRRQTTPPCLIRTTHHTSTNPNRVNPDRVNEHRVTPHRVDASKENPDGGNDTRENPDAWDA